jgi:hypothetical protein
MYKYESEDYQFIKLYVLHLYKNNKQLPSIDKEYTGGMAKLTQKNCEIRL